MAIEVLLVEGKGGVQVTGQVGEVMQESAQAAVSYIKSRARHLGVDPETFEKSDIHIHVPEGAIPKDGPSAGITMATALASALTRRPVRHEVGMSGEITLRGRVLAIGGVREKVLAAHRLKLKTVILPVQNRKDLVEIPRNARREMNLRLVRNMDTVLNLALAPARVSGVTRPPRSGRKTRPAAAGVTRPPLSLFTPGPGFQFPHAIFGIPQGETLTVRQVAGVSGGDVGDLEFDQRGLLLTGNATNLGSSLWVEINRPSGGTGWVSAIDLTQDVPGEAFCSDGRVLTLVEALRTSIVNRDPQGLQALVSPRRGLTVRFDWWNPEIAYRTHEIPSPV